MTDPGTGLPSDNVDAAGGARLHVADQHRRYLWSTIAARDLGVISRREASARSARRCAAGRAGARPAAAASSSTGTTRRPARS